MAYLFSLSQFKSLGCNTTVEYQCDSLILKMN